MVRSLRPLTSDPRRRRLLTTSLALAALTFGVFANCLANRFVWDDEQFVVKNQFLASAAFLPKLLTSNIVAGAGIQSNLYRPLQSLTHWIDVRLWRERVWGHHFSNVLFHVAAAVAVFLLFATLVPIGPAALAAALFAWHPLQSEAVAYISGRGDTLAILWLCVGLLMADRRPVVSLACAALAMASKESMALFPVFVLLYDLARDRQPALRRYLPSALLAAAYVAARLTVLNFHNTLNFYDRPNILTEHVSARLYTYLTTLPKGLSLWLWPADLHHERSWLVYPTWRTPAVMISALFLVWWVATIVWLWRRRRRVAVGLLWFLIATIPTSNLVVLINALFYDHWFLLPGLGLCLAAAELGAIAWTAPPVAQRAAAILASTAVGASVWLTVEYNRVWRSPVSLYRRILAFEPGSAKIHNNLGMAYGDQGDPAKAIEEYREAIRLSDEFPQTHYNLAGALLGLHREEEAMAELRRAVTIDPRFHHAWIRLGVLLMRRGNMTQAAEAFDHARQAYPYARDAYLGLAQLAALDGRIEDARRILDNGLRALPGDPTIEHAADRFASGTPTPAPGGSGSAR